MLILGTGILLSVFGVVEYVHGNLLLANIGIWGSLLIPISGLFYYAFYEIPNSKVT
jgi:hypothetical protein